MTEAPSLSTCPACARPVAVARETCLYCGAILSVEARLAATEAAEKILRSPRMPILANLRTPPAEVARRYLVLDTEGSVDTALAEAFALSIWEARQWLAGPRYRLIRIAAGNDADASVESARLVDRGLRIITLDGAAVARARQPLRVETVDDASDSLLCGVREDPDGRLDHRVLAHDRVRLIVSGPLRRERVTEAASIKKPARPRLEEGLLVHLHVRGEARPFEIDPRRAAFEGDGSLSSYMRTLGLVRQLSASAPHDESFRALVPALGPASDTEEELEGLRKAAGPRRKEPRKPTLDNSAQFRDFSAWRGVLAERLDVATAGER